MMKLNFRLLTVAAALIAFAGCENVPNEQLFAPSASVNAGRAKVAQTGVLAAAQKRAAVIGAEGGSLIVGGHSLVVPPNAVAGPTLFSMQIVEARALHVKLRASRVSDGQAVTQFPVVPVRLTLNAASVQGTELARLKVVYLKDGTYDGAQEILASTVSTTERTVSAALVHFSDYAAALN